MKRLVFIAILSLTALQLSATIRIGATRQEVFEAFGRPTSHLYGGDTEIFLFDNGAKVKVHERRVIAIDFTRGVPQSQTPDTPDSGDWQQYAGAQGDTAPAAEPAAPAGKAEAATQEETGTFAQLGGLFRESPWVIVGLTLTVLFLLLGAGWKAVASR